MNRQPPLPGIMMPPVFVDWHGVISHDNFWYTITENARHPYRDQIEQVRRAIFGREEVVDDWMRGKVSTATLLHRAAQGIHLDARAKDDYVIRRFASDCRRFRLDLDLVSALYRMRQHATIVIATDNMDIPTSVITKRKDVRQFCDDIISSSEVGVLKSESPLRFFGPWLRLNSCSFTDSLLIDDNLENCLAFEAAGGRSLHWTSESSVDDLYRVVV